VRTDAFIRIVLAIGVQIDGDAIRRLSVLDSCRLLCANDRLTRSENRLEPERLDQTGAASLCVGRNEIEVLCSRGTGTHE